MEYCHIWSLIITDEAKTVKPLDPRRQFCQYWQRECNSTADFWFCWVWHPQISQSQSWDHYQPIRCRVCLVLAPSNQPITRAGTTLNQSDSGSPGKVGPEENPTSHTVKIASPCGSKGLTVFGPNHDTSDSSLYLCYPKR